MQELCKTNYVRTKMKTKIQVKTDNLEKAEILNRFFVSIFTKENLEIVPNFPNRTVKHFHTVEVNIDIVEKYIYI